MSHGTIFSSTVHKTEEWLNELQEALHVDDERKAYQALRATLHTLRDRLPPGEAAHLGSQLPMLVRGFYYEGWKPDAPPLKIRTPQEFYDIVQKKASEADKDVVGDAPRVVGTVLGFLTRKISPGEVEHVKRALPDDLGSLWPE